MNELNGQDLITAFLEAMRLRYLEQGQQILRSLETLADRQPSLKPWAEYLQGYLAFKVHHWAEAERILTKLLQTQLEPALRGHILYALGRTFDTQGRWQEAIAAFEQHLSVATELGQTIEQARAWKHIAISYHKGFTRGDFGLIVLQQAVGHCQSALEVLDPIEDPEPDIAYLQGSIWNTLGLIHVSLGQWDEAIACYEQDLAICRTQDDYFGMGITYGNLGEVYQKRGSWSEALAANQQALNLIREYGGHYEEIDVLANVAFLHQEIDQYENALDYYGQTIQVIEDLRAGVSSEEAQAGFFATVVDIYANTILLCLKAGRPAEAFDYVERARSRAFLDTLAAQSPGLSHTLDTTTMTLAQVQAALPPDTLLLEYFTTGLLEVREGRSAGEAERHRFPPAHTLLLVVTHDALQVYDLMLDPNNLRPSQLDSVIERHFLQPQIRRTLYDRLIAPAEDLLQGKRRLYLIPHGPLHYIPFQALVAPNGTTLLHEAGPQLIYSPSATLLFRYGRVKRDQAPAACLALGYNDQGQTRLRFAEGEAHSVAHLTGGQALAGPNPKKEKLYRKAPDYRLLHFSCHGDFNTESPLDSALHIGANETLTGLDVLKNLRLRCNLVTLSACQSGLSRVRRGDELIGFVRAFMYAGTPAVISTLWRVDERSTRLLMEKFYEEIEAGSGFAEALKQAQLYLQNLTRQAVLDTLVRYSLEEAHMADLSDQKHASPLSSLPPTTQKTGSLAHAYLKGWTTGSARHQNEMWLADGDLNEKIFADPFYWAPFVLIGEYGSGLLAA